MNLVVPPGAGDYISPMNTIFYYNGSGGYCGFRTWTDYTESGGIQHVNLAPLPAGQTWNYVGTCQVETEAGYYIKPGGDIYYFNGAGQAGM
jgi:hypothetical protein